MDLPQRQTRLADTDRQGKRRQDKETDRKTDGDLVRERVTGRQLRGQRETETEKQTGKQRQIERNKQSKKERYRYKLRQRTDGESQRDKKHTVKKGSQVSRLQPGYH
jgi:hypothetical protein